ncbi:hypothetical protein BHM03_00031841 [Ensete ventricosum]|nr:hypothetical protein BHM03_00031841 [Ensete ventricosum]
MKRDRTLTGVVEEGKEFAGDDDDDDVITFDASREINTPHIYVAEASPFCQTGVPWVSGLRSGSTWEGLAFRRMTNPLRKRYHEDKQAKKNMKRTKIRMVEFELRLDVGNQNLTVLKAKRGAW